MKMIDLTQGKVSLVDDEDYKLVSRYKWYVSPEGGTYYAARSVRKKGCRVTIKMHRLILGLKPGDGKHVDHINHDGLNNRRSNLRIVTHQQNHFNMIPKKGGYSRFKGVCWCKLNKRWISQIMYNYKNYNLGYFDSENDAAKAYNAKAKELFGEYAYLNKFTKRR